MFEGDFIAATTFKTMLKKERKEIVKAMQDLRIYKPEFDKLIDVYALMLVEYKVKIKKNIDDGFIDHDLQVEIQKLRSEIKNYSSALGLDPKSYYSALKQKNDKKPNKLDALNIPGLVDNDT